MCSTEPLAQIEDDRLYQMEHILPVLERNVEVRNLFDGERFPDTADIELPGCGWHNLVLVNWSDKEEKKAAFALTEQWIGGIRPDRRYLVTEFYSGKYQVNLAYGDEVYMGNIKPHGSAVFKIQEYNPEKPYIVGSDGHYSMGGEIETLDISHDRLILTMNHLFETEIQYQILLPVGYEMLGGGTTVIIRISGAGRKEVMMDMVRKNEVTE